MKTYCSSSARGTGLLVVALAISTPAFAQVVWSFSNSTGAAAQTEANLTASALTAGNLAGGELTFNTSSASDYSGASGGGNAGVRTVTSLSLSTATSTYFEFTLTPTSGSAIQATSLTVGSRSTATGPTVITLYSSVDGYDMALASSSVTANSNWASITLSSFSVTGATGSDITFRLYGAPSSTSTSVNWRIDDLSLSASATSAVPEPATYATFISLVSLGGAVLLRRRKRR